MTHSYHPNLSMASTSHAVPQGLAGLRARKHSMRQVFSSVCGRDAASHVAQARQHRFVTMASIERVVLTLLANFPCVPSRRAPVREIGHRTDPYGLVRAPAPYWLARAPEPGISPAPALSGRTCAREKSAPVKKLVRCTVNVRS